MTPLADVLREGRRRERGMAAFYRSLSGMAEERGDAAAAERLNELLADEQHHVSRLTARLLELGESLGEERPDRPRVEWEGWEKAARLREADEVAWYEAALDRVDDPAARAILEEILASERHHRKELGGKWMAASPPAVPDEGDA